MTGTPRHVRPRARAGALGGLLLLAIAAAPAAQVPFDQVVASLRSPTPGDRVAALRMLRASRIPEAVVPVAALLTDPDNKVQLEALETELSLFLTRPLRTGRRIALVVEVRGPSLAEAAFEAEPDAIVRRPIAPELLQGLLGAMRDETPAVQAPAIYVLGAISPRPADAAASEAVTALIAHPDPRVTSAAMRVAGRWQLTSAGETLIVKLNDPRQPVRLAALDAIGQLREARAVAALADLVDFHGRSVEGLAAFEALARIGHPSSAPLFTSRLTDRDPGFRQRAAEGLGRTGARQHAPLLESGIGVDRSAPVRLAMSYALHRLGTASIDPLLQALAAPRTAAQARAYLLELRPGVTATLQDYLRSPSAPTRAAAAEMLGIIADRSTLLVLEPLATSEADPQARAAVALALDRIRAANPEM